MKAFLGMGVVAGIGWVGFWWTPDQQGDRLMRRDRFQEAAEVYRDPMRQGVAWFRAGEFEKAAQAFARASAPEAEFNRGNCLVMRGKYDEAVERYDRALELRPGWADAQTNRAIALARAKLVERTGGDMGDQKIGADEISFDRKEGASGEETELPEAQPISDQAMQELWLRRVQTKPADFLRAKFAYQLAIGDRQGGEP